MTQFLNLLTGEEAWRVFVARYRPEVSIEKIPTVEAQGRVLALAATAPHELPTFVRSTVDGYAVLGTPTRMAHPPAMPAYLDVVAEAPMGQLVDFVLEAGPGGPGPHGRHGAPRARMRS